MLKKLAGYSLLSLLSFGLFSIIFHSVASAQPLLSLQPTPSRTLPDSIPTPTIFVYKQSSATTKQAPSPTVFAYRSQIITPLYETTVEKQSDAITTTDPQTPAISTVPMATATPTPTLLPNPTPLTILPISPSEMPTVADTSDLETLFSFYSTHYHTDENELKKIAACESGFNTNADNNGMYLGMFQFAAASWSSVRVGMGLDPNPDLRTNAADAIQTAAYMLADGQENAWPACH